MKHILHLLRILTISSTSLLLSLLTGVVSGQTADPTESTIAVSSTSVSTDVGSVVVTVQVNTDEGDGMGQGGDTVAMFATLDGVTTVITGVTDQNTGAYVANYTNTAH